MAAPRSQHGGGTTANERQRRDRPSDGKLQQARHRVSINLELTSGLRWRKWKLCKSEEFLPLLPSGTFLFWQVHGFCTDRLC